MKKITLFILLGLGISAANAQSSWSFLQNKNLSAGIGIQSSDGTLNINYLKKENRNQLLLISKKDMNCLICNMEFNFGNRAINAEVEYLYKNSNNEYIYAILNKSVMLRGFSYAGNFTITNLKNNDRYNFSGNVPVNFFNKSDFIEWQNKNKTYQTDSLNYYTGKSNSIIYATIAVNEKISSIQTISMNGLNLNCNPSCDIQVYFSSGNVNYKIIREDNVGKIVYRLPENFIQDMRTYNKGKDLFSIKVNSVEKGDIIFKFDSSTFEPLRLVGR